MARKSILFRRLGAALLALLLLPAGAWAAEPEPAQAAPALGIYTTGDMMGRVGETDPLTGLTEENSYLKVATAMAAERQTMESTLLLASGDAVANTLASGSAADTALALRTIGYDGLVPSVEEFRLGQGHRAAFFRDLTQEGGTGTPVELISADWMDGQSGQAAAQPYHIYTRQLGEKELRIAVVGLGTLEVPQSLPSYYYSDSQFGHTDNTGMSYVWEWEHWIWPQVARQECDLVIVCCHTDRKTLEKFAAQTTGIDLLVNGHSEADAGVLKNLDGQPVSWVSGGGTALTRTVVTLSDSGTPVIGESKLLALSGYENDEALAKATANGQKAQQARAAQKTGTLSGSWAESVTSATRQTAAADLVARAMLWTSGADAALVTNGSLGYLPEQTGTGSGSRPLTLGDCATLARGTSPVVLVELTGAQLEGWLEVCAGRYQVDESGQVTGGQDADFLYGMDYELYVGGQAGQRVVNLTWQGQPVERNRTYRVILEAAHLLDDEFPHCTVLWSAAADMQYAATGGTMASLLAAYASRTGAILPQRESTWAVYAGAVDSAMTRLEFVELLYDVADRPKPGANVAFADVSGSDAVVWAAEKRIVSGDGKGKFLPQMEVTREQAAAMLYNYAKAEGLDLTADGSAVSTLSDRDAVSGWAVTAVDFCLRNGLLEPVNGQFRPSATMTRAEVQRTMAVLDTLN
ncbi:5'-nucleotidase C-terminal domain-containing protein [uncultured Flavonifractor sp.]|uniref:5'-nucleotidase C-terminal domain-containing protein n=1 Tax=Candidatus Flavonifractor intestinigallinarum TaxID=2838586 RepID=A0A9D2SBA2_9FIRM|nr:5'-nucleotidase C-terminal domain-containing protein [uncultured Flavonifractor sp.]HJB80391.1 5'-nucleotidase C-terminal domain-containing protein [Candidatus Flavonifractor intestinigallinarum]